MAPVHASNAAILPTVTSENVTAVKDSGSSQMVLSSAPLSSVAHSDRNSLPTDLDMNDMKLMVVEALLANVEIPNKDVAVRLLATAGLTTATLIEMCEDEDLLELGLQKLQVRFLRRRLKHSSA